MADQIGVFVPLPLSDEQKDALILAVYDGDYGEGIQAIGTLVQGGELEVCTAIEREHERYVPEVISFRPDIVPIGEKISLVRQSDAQAQIAMRNAEIVRLNTELSGYRAGLSELVSKEVAEVISSLKGSAP